EKLRSRTDVKTAGPGAGASPSTPAGGATGAAPTAGGTIAAAGGIAAGAAGALASILLGSTGPRGAHHDGLVESAAQSAARADGSNLGRAIIRGALGSILGGGSGTTRRTR